MSTISVQSVAARTKLVTLHFSTWRATRLHKKETRETNDRHGTKAAKVLTKVCEHPALAALDKLHAEAYAVHRAMTLPSIQDGMRLLPVGQEFEHSDKMKSYRLEHERLVAEFLADYPNEMATAPIRLNGLYDSSMWPSESKIAGKFGWEVRYLSCPTEGSWGEWLNASVEAADSELRDRLTEALERVRDRCGSDGKLYASVFSALEDLVAMAPDLDLTGAPDIAAAVQAARPLAKCTAEQLRGDKTARADASAQAANILSMLGGVA